MLFQPRPWIKGDKFSATHLNQGQVISRSLSPIIASGIAEFHMGTGGSGIYVPDHNRFTDIRHGLIVDKGPDGDNDHFDERYFVKFAFSEPLGIREQLVFKFDEPAKDHAGEFQETFPVTVINKIEEKSHTHFLRTDGSRLVTVLGYWDDESNKHWVMWEQPEQPIGIITATGPAGEADFTDHRYWVKLARIENDSDAANIVNDYQIMQIPVGPNQPGGLSGPNPDYAGKKTDFIVKIENLAEKADGTHNLATDGTVVVLIFYQLDQTKNADDEPTPELRYFTIFGGAGKGGMFPAKIRAVHGANATTATGFATINYDIEDEDAVLLGAGMTPVVLRPQGKLRLPGVGAWVDMFKSKTGVLFLWNAGEAKEFGPCTTS